MAIHALTCAASSVKVRGLDNPDLDRMLRSGIARAAMSYTVLARKYRPQTFSDLVGQEHVSRTLANAIKSGRVAHAFLLTGARGVGKTTTARLLAKSLNCERGPTPEPCNQCDPCREITIGTDLDVLEIDGASNNSVDDVRRLQESLPYRPARDRFKIVIVDEVHMLSAGAFNAFLKTLEEPPSHVKFIFATTEIHKVPITIRSRCQRHDFRLIPHALVAARVREILNQEQMAADDEAIAIVVREAGGSLRDALTVLEQLLAFGGTELKGEDVARGLGIADQRSVLSVAQAVLTGDAATCVRSIAALAEQGLDLLHFARQLLSLLRDLVVLRVAGEDPQLIDRAEQERQSALELANAHSPQHLERSFAALALLVDEVAQTANPQLVLEMGLVRMADRPPLEPLSELLARLTALEARMQGGGGAPTPERGAGPSGGGGTGRGPRRAAPGQAQASGPGGDPPPELRVPARVPPTPRRGDPGSPPRRPSESEIALDPPDLPVVIPPRAEVISEAAAVSGTAPDDGTVPAPAPAQPAAPEAAPPPDDGNHDDVPEAWQKIIAALHEAQPALGAVLEHGVPVQVDARQLRVSFPEGSFFGRQAMSSTARQALGDAAASVLGQTPRIEIGYGLRSTRPTVAAVQQARQKEKRAEVVVAALNHPKVKDAMDVFPEAEGNVEVQVEVD
jgi:DNA polymerase-3 subunit gamma/tau